MPSSINFMEILLVEDNPSDVELTVGAFENCKIANKINVVNDGEEALDYLYKRKNYADAQRPNVILLDLNLPRQNGQEILQVIKNDDSLKSIPVVILTSSEAERDVLKSYNLHANCYIIKPVDAEKFLQVVSSIENFWLGVVKLPIQNINKLAS